MPNGDDECSMQQLRTASGPDMCNYVGKDTRKLWARFGQLRSVPTHLPPWVQEGTPRVGRHALALRAASKMYAECTGLEDV